MSAAAPATVVVLFALVATALHVGCGGAVAETPVGDDTNGSSDAAVKVESVRPDASSSTDVAAESSFTSDDSDTGSTVDAAGGSSVRLIDASMDAVGPASQTDA